MDPAVPLDQLVNFCVGANEQLAALGAEALARREEQRVCDRTRRAPAPLCKCLGRVLHAAFLVARADRPVISLALAGAQTWWARSPLFPKMLNDFVDARLSKSESPELGKTLDSNFGSG
jgi:hypothetical protein